MIIKRKHYILMMLIFFILVFIGFYYSNIHKQNNIITQEPEINFGITSSPVSWLSYIAFKKGYYQQQGLNIKVQQFVSGKRALNALLNNKLDYCVSAEVPLAYAALNSKKFKIIATIGSADTDIKILARKDHGISNLKDLAGKKIATQSNSSAHFFMDLFLSKHNLINNIEHNFLKIEQLPNELFKGTVDAISTREPYLTQVLNTLGDKVIIFEETELYRKSFHLVANLSVMSMNSNQSKKLIRAHIQAAKWIIENQNEAEKFIAKSVNLDKSEVRRFLLGSDLNVRLDQSLLQSLEDVGGWLINHNYKKSKSIPNYLFYIYPNYLYGVNPTAVNLIL